MTFLMGEIDMKGFTLIELLVVVLIIGILSAVALPQYQKTVWRSRAAEMKTQVRALAQAQQSYYLANGTYPRSQNIYDLDLSYSGWEQLGVCGLASTSISAGKNPNYVLVLHNTGTDTNPGMRVSSAVWADGPYVCSGLAYIHSMPGTSDSLQDKIYCWYRAGGGGKNWCTSVWGAKNSVVGAEGWWAYELP